jgi:hypothetical protein
VRTPQSERWAASVFVPEDVDELRERSLDVHVERLQYESAAIDRLLRAVFGDEEQLGHA